MMCAVNRLFMVVFLLLVSEVALAQSISMNPSALRIEEDGQLNLEIRIRGNADEYEEPDLKDWRVVSSGSSSQTQIINGQFSRERVFTKVLEPLRTGILTIGKSVLTRMANRSLLPAIQIRVEPERELATTSCERPPDCSNMREKTSLCFRVSPATPYVGEPFVLSYYLYYRRGMNLSSEKVSLPNLDGSSLRIY